jgi:hypothetical protein
MNQEIYAWLPHSGRYLPITAEDGRVLALVKSPDGRRIVFMRAGRLVRMPGQPDLLRGLSVRQLDLPSMTMGPVIDLPGDVRQLAMWSSGGGAVDMEVAGPGGASGKFRFDGQTLEPVGAIRGRFSASAHPVILTAAGVELGTRVVTDAACGFSAHDETDAQGLPRIRVLPRKGKAFLLDARYGAGVDGLPFPRSASAKALSPARKTR